MGIAHFLAVCRHGFIVLACLLAACGDARVSVGPLPKDAVILAFGDSLTYGTGAGASEAYPARLEALTGYRVINAGVPGETSDEGVARLPALLDEYRPDLVVLCHGGNDILRNRVESETERDLGTMIDMIRKSGAEVLLIGVPEKSLFLGTAPVYSRIAESMNVPFVDEVLADVLGDRDLKSDTVHPNAEGYRVIAERIAEVIE